MSTYDKEDYVHDQTCKKCGGQGHFAKKFPSNKAVVASTSGKAHHDDKNAYTTSWLRDQIPDRGICLKLIDKLNLNAICISVQ